MLHKDIVGGPIVILFLLLSLRSRSWTRPSISIHGTTAGGIGVAAGFLVFIIIELSSRTKLLTVKHGLCDNLSVLLLEIALETESVHHLNAYRPGGMAVDTLDNNDPVSYTNQKTHINEPSILV